MINNDVLFTVDVGSKVMSAGRRHDIEKVMLALGIPFDKVKYHKHANTDLYYSVDSTDFNHLSPKIFTEYDALVYFIDKDEIGNTSGLLHADLYGNHFYVGELVYDVPFSLVNTNNREWFHDSAGKYSYVKFI